MKTIKSWTWSLLIYIAIVAVITTYPHVNKEGTLLVWTWWDTANVISLGTLFGCIRIAGNKLFKK